MKMGFLQIRNGLKSEFFKCIPRTHGGVPWGFKPAKPRRGIPRMSGVILAAMYRFEYGSGFSCVSGGDPLFSEVDAETHRFPRIRGVILRFFVIPKPPL